MRDERVREEKKSVCGRIGPLKFLVRGSLIVGEEAGVHSTEFALCTYVHADGKCMDKL